MNMNSFHFIGLVNPLLTFFIQLDQFHLLRVFLCSPRKIYLIVCEFMVGLIFLDLLHAFFVLFYKKVNFFSKNEIVFVGINKFGLLPSTWILFSGIWWKWLNFFNFERFTFLRLWCQCHTTELFDRILWHGFI